jgi:hypothetical protein
MHGSDTLPLSPRKWYIRYLRYIPLIKRSLMYQITLAYRVRRIIRYTKTRIGMAMYRTYRTYRLIEGAENTVAV